MTGSYRMQIVLCDLVGIVFFLFTFISINNARKYIIGTNKILTQYEATWDMRKIARATKRLIKKQLPCVKLKRFSKSPMPTIPKLLSLLCLIATIQLVSGCYTFQSFSPKDRVNKKQLKKLPESENGVGCKLPWNTNRHTTVF